MPFKGRLEGDVTVTPLAPPFLQVDVEATGKATHLGKFTLDVPHVVNPTTSAAVGSYEFTAANGDKVYAKFTGIATPHGDTCRPLHRGDRNHHGRHGSIRRRHRELHQRSPVRHDRRHDHRFLRRDHLLALIQERKAAGGALPPSKPPPARHRPGARSARRMGDPRMIPQTAPFCEEFSP